MRPQFEATVASAPPPGTSALYLVCLSDRKSRVARCMAALKRQYSCPTMHFCCLDWFKVVILQSYDDLMRLLGSLFPSGDGDGGHAMNGRQSVDGAAGEEKPTKELPVSFQIWLAFVAAAAVVLIIPGPTILTVISYSVSHGRRAGIPLIAAVALGDSTALVLSLVGLGALLAASVFWFTVIKLTGGCYLLYLGIRLLRAGGGTASLSTPAAPAATWKLFANTYLVTATNPKGIIFFVAFLPQFINNAAPVAPQLWLLATTFVLLATVNAACYATFADAARRLLGSARAQRRFNLTGGSLLCAAGIWSLMARRIST